MISPASFPLIDFSLRLRANVINAGVITTAALNTAYLSILQTLHKHELRATAAFVTCFAAEADVMRDHLPLFEQMAEINPAWFGNMLPVLRSGSLDGWSGNGFYRAMATAGHEMAWHGTTHLHLSDLTTREAINLELELATKLFTSLGHTPRTIVFPRNQVGNLSILRHYGFEAYRAGLPNGLSNKLMGLLNEWNIYDQGVLETPKTQDGWQVSPAGQFLNWPSGIRALVPVSVTIRRWKSLLTTAMKRGGFVHMWFHPHNFITAPAMKTAFEEIMRFVSELVKSGDMVNLTMSEANEFYKMGRPE